MSETDSEAENRQWKRLVQDLAYSFSIQNSEQINTPDHARMAFIRHLQPFKAEMDSRELWEKSRTKRKH